MLDVKTENIDDNKYLFRVKLALIFIIIVDIIELGRIPRYWIEIPCPV